MTRAEALTAGGLLGAWLIFAVVAVWGVGGVPFHPDESTYLYMSHDFDLLFRQADVAAVTWRAASQPAEVINYRLLDGPLTHFLPGLGRLFGGFGLALPHDWDWSASWAANDALGALPPAGLLGAARWPAAVLIALSLAPLFGLGARLGGLSAGVLAAGLYALSGLVLLHGRRAMAEGPLLFFSLTAIWALVRWPRRPLIAGGLTALAVAAKLTALAVLPVAALVFAVGQPQANGGQGRWRTRLGDLALYGVAWVGLSWLLTPPLWSQPMAGLSAMVSARQSVLTQQTSELAVAAPGQVLGSLGERLFAMLYHVFFAPPAFWDVPNYAAQTRASELAYLSLPWQVGWHTTRLDLNLVAGGAVLALTLAGLAFGVHDLIAHRLRSANTATAVERGTRMVLLAWSAATVLALLPISIAWQRYYLPLVPIVCLWAAYGWTSLIRPFVRAAIRPR